ncbi:MAG TPA: UbiA family prenyltransferase [Steroidobacteraceae bacterium]|nr:UbiA family prenyltransferase [Steroidobacteraceae bacterium]
MCSENAHRPAAGAVGAGDITAGGGPAAVAVARAWVQELRPHQWLKNCLVAVPLAAAHRLGIPGQLRHVICAFVAFCLCASGIYFLNDLLDAEVDREHPHKRHRPLAAGRLPRGLALASIPVLTLAGLALGARVGGGFTVVLVLYLGTMTLYSLRLRSIVLLDALVLAGGYALRVIGGGLAVHIRPSPRLLAFCIFLFFSLALVKRYAELVVIRGNGPGTHARGYLEQDGEFIMALGCASGILAVLVLALYMDSANVERLYSRSGCIWATAVLLLYWVSHMWLMAHRGRMTDDPLVFAVRNPTSIALITLMGAAAWLAV